MELDQRIREAVARALRHPAESGRETPQETPQQSPLETDFWVPVGISARHIHLSQEDVERLFGPGHTLQPMRDLQPGQFACKETVTLVGPRAAIAGVRVLGPARGRTQVEIAASDGFALGVHPPVRLSGDIEGTPGIAVVGPRGAIYLSEGVIVAKRHIHIPPAEAAAWSLHHGQVVNVEFPRGPRALTLGQVVVRVHESFRLELHLDTDEANAAGLRTGDWCRVLEARPARRG